MESPKPQSQWTKDDERLFLTKSFLVAFPELSPSHQPQSLFKLAEIVVRIGRTKPMTVQEALSRSRTRVRWAKIRIPMGFFISRSCHCFFTVARKPMELFDSKEKQDRGHLVVYSGKVLRNFIQVSWVSLHNSVCKFHAFPLEPRQFDWLKVTSGYLDDDYACMVRIKFDEVYVPLGST